MLDALTVRSVDPNSGLILAGLEPHRVRNYRSFRVWLPEPGARYRPAFLQIVDVDLGDARIDRIGNFHVSRPAPRQLTSHQNQANDGDHRRDPAPS